MKSYEYKRFYHPKLGRYIYKHKGSGIIVDNIFKPIRKVASVVLNKFAKPVAKKAIQTGISKAGDKLSKKASEKAGDMIIKRLSSMRKPTEKKENIDRIIKKLSSKRNEEKENESTYMIINRLISGEGLK